MSKGISDERPAIMGVEDDDKTKAKEKAQAMNSDIERLARAACQKDCRCEYDTWNMVGEYDRQRYIEITRAILSELRKPSKQMLKAACKSMSPNRRPTPEWVTVNKKHTIRFQAMLDSITEEDDDKTKAKEKAQAGA